VVTALIKLSLLEGKMDQQIQSHLAIARSDQDLARIVDAGIGYYAKYGQERAAAYLIGCGVKNVVIARVLSEPHRRRGSAANLIGTPGEYSLG